MKARDMAELLALAAIWGASFLFMRIAAPAFGPVAVSALRVAGACVLLLPLLFWHGQWPALRAHWRTILWVGLTNSALPFVCFAYAATSIQGGLSAVLNATTPMWGMLWAWAWLGDKPSVSRLVGLALGFAGVLSLSAGSSGAQVEAALHAPVWAMVACLLATCLYGFSAAYTRKFLQGVPALALACGSQLSASLLLLPLAWFEWPAAWPGATPWLAVLALAVLCTGLAYVLYFRLVAHIGVANTITVTYLIPLFAISWGALFLGERLSLDMLLPCALIVLGTALVVGAWERWQAKRQA